MKRIDYHGQPHAQDVLNLIEDVIKNKQKYQSRGAKLPKGILLIGEPGVGKTLFARVLAERLNKELLIIKPTSDNQSAEIEKIFKLAKESDKYIILIDELMAMIVNDPKTEGQILAQLDDQSDLLIVATTSANEGELRDHQALTRPGRFDIKLQLNQPETEARLEFFKQRLSKYGEFDYDRLTDYTIGHSYAFLDSLINQTLLYGIHLDEPLTDNFIETCANRMSGYMYKPTSVPYQQRFYLAVHEVGHALYGVLLNKKLAMVRINLDGRSGSTDFDDDDYLIEIKQSFEQISLNLAGYVACQTIFKKHIYGAYRDFNMVRNHFFDIHRYSLLHENKMSIPFDRNGDEEVYLPSYQLKFNNMIRRTRVHLKTIINLHRSIIIKYAHQLVNEGSFSKKMIDDFAREILMSPKHRFCTKHIKKYFKNNNH